MAVFSTNLIIYAHTDFEQTFLLEDNQSNSAKDLTGFTATARMKRQFAGGQLYSFTVEFPNRPLGKVRITMTSATTGNIPPDKYFYELNLTDSSGQVERVIEGIAIVKQPVTWPSPAPLNPWNSMIP